MSVLREMNGWKVCYRDKNKKANDFLIYWTYLSGKCVPFKGIYVATTYPKLIGWDGVLQVQ